MTLAPSRSSPWRTPSIVVASVLAVVAVAAVAGLVLIRTTYFQHTVVRYAASRLSRQIEVRGALTLDLLSSTPTFTGTDVTLSNPAWMPAGVTAEIGKLTMVFDFPWPGRQKSILRLDMQAAKLHLVRDAEGRANWQWSPPETPKRDRAWSSAACPCRTPTSCSMTHAGTCNSRARSPRAMYERRPWCRPRRCESKASAS